ncbi:hypothetical protein [Novosphingobium album (ex Hu et al. 2023)]|uniref:Uncharacterized protein n=1 Tax=Novosphingobium album (ex Hu et al. 2023) TaxID=2930093 RepID=A0ABT0AYQ9_9SPHN|nr:hypothetical protein [Novosphingobium album (ex Hu et al. 2023)]MCJ2177849.1 hypothetical protein [Novosphingobium album (ex Hu et al. 2023)]
MMFLRIIAFVFGVLAVAMGLLWVCQGTGVLMWPAESFMLSDRTWATRGAVLTAVGCILLWLVVRRNGNR